MNLIVSKLSLIRSNSFHVFYKFVSKIRITFYTNSYQKFVSHFIQIRIKNSFHILYIRTKIRFTFYANPYQKFVSHCIQIRIKNSFHIVYKFVSKIRFTLYTNSYQKFVSHFIQNSYQRQVSFQIQIRIKNSFHILYKFVSKIRFTFYTNSYANLLRFTFVFPLFVKATVSQEEGTCRIRSFNIFLYSFNTIKIKILSIFFPVPY